MSSFNMAFDLIIVFLVTESWLRPIAEGKRFNGSKTDQETIHQLGLAYCLAILVIAMSPLINLFRVGRIADTAIITWIGIAMMLSGLALRIWARQVFRKLNMDTFQTMAEPQLVREGLYRRIRHPSYLGGLTFWAGGSLVTNNWIIAIGLIIALVAVYRGRIKAEENMLLETFGRAYQDYSQTTWRLIPFLF